MRNVKIIIIGILVGLVLFFVISYLGTLTASYSLGPKLDYMGATHIGYPISFISSNINLGTPATINVTFLIADIAIWSLIGIIFSFIISALISKRNK